MTPQAVSSPMPTCSTALAAFSTLLKTFDCRLAAWSTTVCVDTESFAHRSALLRRVSVDRLSEESSRLGVRPEQVRHRSGGLLGRLGRRLPVHLHDRLCEALAGKVLRTGAEFDAGQRAAHVHGDRYFAFLGLDAHFDVREKPTHLLPLAP